MTSIIGIGFALAGALVALIWLPARAETKPVVAVGAEATEAGDLRPLTSVHAGS